MINWQKKKDLGWNLIILTLQGMMNDITIVFEGWKPTLSHSSKMSVGQNSINCVCVCVCVCVWKWKILWGNWTVSHSVIQPKHLRYPLPRNMWYSKFYSPTPQWWSWLPWQHCYLHKCHVQWRGKFTLHKSGFMFLKEGNSCISSIVTIHSG